MFLGSGSSSDTSPERELGCAIIRQAVKEWRKAKPGSLAYDRLLEFFNGEWFEFLWSSLMPGPVEVALDRLGVPGLVIAGVQDGGQGSHVDDHIYTRA